MNSLVLPEVQHSELRLVAVSEEQQPPSSPNKRRHSASSITGLQWMVRRVARRHSATTEQQSQQQQRPSRHRRFQPLRRHRRGSDPSSSSSCNNNPAVMEFLIHECPALLLPHILSFCAPQTVSALNRTNQYFHAIIQQEGFWKTQCLNLYKWKEGDPEPVSWKEYYRRCPCVPIDYKSLASALACHPLKIWVRPGTHSTTSLTISSAMELETQQGPFHTATASPSTTPTTTSPCGSSSSSTCHHDDTCGCSSTERSDDSGSSVVPTTTTTTTPTPLRARIVLQPSRRYNEPLFKVVGGRASHLTIKHVDLSHYSHGADIWNGNAALQIWNAHATLVGTQITSTSGRGIVCLDHASSLKIFKSAICDCAATGIYMGGGTATLDHTDIVRNGRGNKKGIAKGHSGIYMEQGTAQVTHCTISKNSLTGISAVTARLIISHCDLTHNGSHPLEVGDVVQQQQRHHHHHQRRFESLQFQGPVRMRSGLLRDDNDNDE